VPVQRFRTFAEAEKALQVYFPDEAYYRRVVALWSAARKLCPPVPIQRGVRRFRSFSEKSESDSVFGNTVTSEK
jgi:hypothetical protein